MALAHVGCNVVVYGASPDAATLKVDQALAGQHGFAFKSVAPMSRAGCVSYIRCNWPRVRSRIGHNLFRMPSISNGWQIGPSVPELFRAARQANVDYYIVHLEQGAWVGARLLDLGYRVGFDLEDWYSEDLLPEARKQRPLRLLRDMERKLLLEGAHATCPSRAMRDALAQQYLRSPPAVVCNAFPWSERAPLMVY